jgi:arylsulfatase A-like enzyme
VLKDLSQQEVDFLLDLYDEEVFFTDAGIGRLLDALRRLDRYEDTIIVVTSDHGEEFREHGWLGHTRTLYQELVRVPLIVSAPGYRDEPRVVSDPVSLVSITPTILDLLEIDAAERSFHEPSLASRMRAGGDGDGDSSWVLTEVGFLPPGAPRSVKRAFKKGIVGNRFKLIRDEETHAVELYDLESDPGETRNLADERPELRDRLLGVLEDRLRRARAGAQAPDLRHLTEEEIETLRGLGYVGS